MVKKIILTIVIALFRITTFAQAVNEVTLVVSGEASTKQEATALALRSAIEQAFGVFVSANISILNDELVKDEIATISSGNIKKFKEVATATLTNGNIIVTLEAIVSIQKLVSYAQSKGSTAEFAGASFGMNMKLRELNKINEEKAIAHMISQIEALMPSMFNYKLELGEPRIPTRVGTVYINDEIHFIGTGHFREKVLEREIPKNVYEIPAKILVTPNKNAEVIISILFKTLESLSLPRAGVEDYKKANLKIYDLNIGRYVELYVSGNNRLSQRASFGHSKMLGSKKPYTFTLRSEKSRALINDFFDFKIYDAVFNFKIVDNLGQISDIGSVSSPYFGAKTGIIGSFHLVNVQGLNGWNSYCYSLSASTNFDPFCPIGVNGDRQTYKNDDLLYIPFLTKKPKPNAKKYALCGRYEILLFLDIPQEDITKYNNFTISSK